VSNSIDDGIRSATRFGGASISRGSGVVSSRVPMMSAPDTPSIAAWCTLV